MNVSIKLYLKIMGVILMLPIYAYTDPTPNLFKFITSKPFFFNRVGEHAEFVLNISDAKRYELALETSQEIFPNSVVEDRPFNWKVEVSVWRDGKMLNQKVLDRLVAGWPLDRNDSFLGRISLGLLPAPLDGNICSEFLSEISLGLLSALRSRFFTREFVVRVVVIQVDERYTDKNLPVRIGVRHSPLE